MKKCRLFFGTFATIAAVSLGGMYVSAAASEDSNLISIVTDKSEYNTGDSVKETIILNNTTGKILTDIVVEGSVPDGYKLKDGTENNWKENIERLAVGEEKEIAVKELIVKSNAGNNGEEKEKINPTDKIGGVSGNNDTKDADKGVKKDNKSKQNTKKIEGNKVKTDDYFNVVFWIAVAAFGITAVLFAIKNKKLKHLLSLTLAVMMIGGMLPADTLYVEAAENKDNHLEQNVTKTIKVDGKDITLSVKAAYCEIEDNMVKTEDDLIKEGYKLKWQDDFNGNELNRADWNVELHDPGWVNAELQAYVDSDENIQVKDGNLLIKPVEKVNEDGTKSYTSGRVNTQGKHDFKYGYFECRAKVPTGKGYLPAFWMMPTDENLYGQWPKCGEIDCMEVMGQETNKVYGTIHYGEPHDQSQGTYTVDESENFADNYHTFACEWEPGKIIWYIDGIKYHEESDWFSAREGQGTVTYPAPFDQPFYMILNLAVGGSWVGYPDENTTYEDQQFAIDYVKVYQKDSYNEDVEKPEKSVFLRDPDENGNYIVNGDFSKIEDLTDDVDWKFITAMSGEANAKIENKQMIIETTNAGTADYSIQLVQPDIPMQKGAEYKLTFDAYADKERTMITGISAPDHNYTRYFNDTKVELSPDKKEYVYTFRMEKDDDANGRLEFNLGNTDSTATVYISNVRLEKTGYSEIKEDATKKVLADGNCVYNGGFQEGKGRLGYWDINKDDASQISVTNDNNDRKLKIVASDAVSAENPITIGQKELALSKGTNYAMSFMAKGDNGNKLKISAGGNEFEELLDGTEKTFKETFSLVEQKNANRDLLFTITKPGTYFIDDVRIVEDSLIKNGNFNAGLSGFEAYCYTPSNVTCVVDSLTEDNAADFTIKDTGDADWHIQLKQTGVKLEKNQWYRISMKMKSSLDRKVSYALQRNGNSDIHKDDWTPYRQNIVELGNEYQTYSQEFKMNFDTDDDTVFNVTMGAIDGKQIKEQHRICIDDIVLEKIDEPKDETPEKPSQPMETNMISNGDFSNGLTNWENSLLHGNIIDVQDNKAVITVNDVGSEEHSCQLIQKNIGVEKGATYEIKFKIESSVARKIKFALMIPDVWDWYTGDDITLHEGENEYAAEVTINKDSTDKMALYFTMGYLNEDVGTHTIKISDVSMIKK